MTELRWNPLLGTWTMVAASRQNRPHMRPDSCPFCPGKGKLKDYEVLKYDNDFPALMDEPPEPAKIKSRVYRTAKAAGKCEVILYSPDHKKALHELSAGHIRKIIDLWQGRTVELSKNKKIKYIFPFENKGEEVGVTMLHPHGQIYAYPYVPLKLKVELDNAKSYYKENKKCVICEMNRDEQEAGMRVIYENADFLVYLPHFTDYPYGVFISSRAHRKGFAELTSAEKDSLADALKVTEGSFEKIFNRPFPFMMCSHQCPVNSPEYKDSGKYFHLHIEFYPPLRAKDRVKWYASSESGAWAAANVAVVEETAKQMVAAKYKYFAATDAQRLKAGLKQEFIRFFGGKEQGLRVFSAPARINIIGEHIDYNGGLVMPAAIGLRTYALIRKRKDKKIIIKNLNTPETVKLDIGKKYVFDSGLLWANYPAGVLDVMTKAGFAPDTGFEVLFFSEIPDGAGVSSSAAFEVVLAHALSEMYGFKISGKDIALLSQKAENEFVGMKCGIMDQYASALSKKSHAMLLDCASLDREYIPFEFGDYRIVVANTNKKRELAGSKYNERLSECMEALSGLQKTLKIKNLCEMSPAVFEANKALIKNPAALKRARHAVYENDRVKKASIALKDGDAACLGKLLVDSHESLKNDYEVTGFELDSMVDEGAAQKGCLGGRMTGAGFGGCAIFIVHKDSVYDFKLNVAAGYKRRTGLMADFYVCEAEDGVKEE